MVALDIRTMMVMIALAAVLTAGALIVVRRLHLGIPGINWWAWGNVLGALGFVLGTLRGILPDFFTIVLFNTCLLTGSALALSGCRLFVGRSGWGWLAPVVAVGIAGSMAWFAFVEPSVAHRVQITSLAGGALIGLAAWALMQGARSLARRITGLLYAIHAVFYGVRGTFAFAVDIQDFMKPGAMTEVAFLVTFAFLLSAILGQIVMTAERLQEELRRQADRDGLTDALNRRAFRLVAEKALAQVRRNEGVVSLLSMDLDYFKRLNDTNGHAAGDAMLKAFVAVAGACLRQQDSFCRHGGEEFVALLPDTDRDGALALAERLRQALAATRVAVEGGEVATTVSIGVAEGRGGSVDLDELLRRSDAALYRAKAAGRDCVSCA